MEVFYANNFDGCAGYSAFCDNGFDAGPLLYEEDAATPGFFRMRQNPLWTEEKPQIILFSDFLNWYEPIDYKKTLDWLFYNKEIGIGKKLGFPQGLTSYRVADATIKTTYLTRIDETTFCHDVIVIASLLAHYGSRIIPVTEWYRFRTIRSVQNDLMGELEISIYKPSDNMKGWSLLNCLAPDFGFGHAGLEDGAAQLLRCYYDKALRYPCRVDARELADNMGYAVREEALSDDRRIRSRVVFDEMEITVYDPDTGSRKGKTIREKTILVDPAANHGDSYNFTEDSILHECNHVFWHPDKICDQIADAIVTDCLQHDKNSRVAIECLFKNRNLIIAGELSSTHKPDYRKLVAEVFDRINNTDSDNPYAPTSRTDAGMDYKLDFAVEDLDIEILVDHQSGDIALGVNKGGAGDQGVMFGYATGETPELLPIPFVVATRFLRLLKAYPCRMLKADAKAQVSFDYETGKITTFLCSVQHVHGVEVEDFRDIIEKLMVRTATLYGLNTDFVKLVNPTGRFVIGSSFADCGVTGRKLACDTYGGIGHIGGGALSGKDPSKVDRSATYAARKIARDIVSAGYADKAEVQIAYAIGVAEPVSVHVETFGTEHQDKAFITQYVRENYDLTPRGIIDSLGLLEMDYNRVSAYGHFGRNGLPWESKNEFKKI